MCRMCRRCRLFTTCTSHRMCGMRRMCRMCRMCRMRRMRRIVCRLHRMSRMQRMRRMHRMHRMRSVHVTHRMDRLHTVCATAPCASMGRSTPASMASFSRDFPTMSARCPRDLFAGSRPITPGNLGLGAQGGSLLHRGVASAGSFFGSVARLCEKHDWCFYPRQGSKRASCFFG